MHVICPSCQKDYGEKPQAKEGKVVTCRSCEHKWRLQGPKASKIESSSEKKKTPHKNSISDIAEKANQGGGLLFIIAAGISIYSPLLFLVYAPIYLIAFILSIVVMSKGKIRAGISLALTTLILGPLIGFLSVSWRVHDVIHDARAASTEAASNDAGENAGPKGAFGYEFGADVDTSLLEEGKLTNGKDYYSFQPEQPFRSFNQYRLLISPQTKRVAMIWAKADFDSNERAKSELELIASLLVDKYGGTIERPLSFGSEQIDLEYGNRLISLSVDDFKKSLDLRYLDGEICVLMDNEYLELEKSQIDSSSL